MGVLEDEENVQPFCYRHLSLSDTTESVYLAYTTRFRPIDETGFSLTFLLITLHTAHQQQNHHGILLNWRTSCCISIGRMMFSYSTPRRKGRFPKLSKYRECMTMTQAIDLSSNVIDQVGFFACRILVQEWASGNCPSVGS